jgi:hypothetical protein
MERGVYIKYMLCTVYNERHHDERNKWMAPNYLSSKGLIENAKMIGKAGCSPSPRAFPGVEMTFLEVKKD